MVGGLDKQIKEIKEVIELPVKHPELFESLGIAQPKGVILYGPPGTGKTLLARAVAHHTDCKFIRVSGSELVQKYIGEGSRMVRELFVMAREHAPSIIFMDEIDSIGSSRSESSSGGGDSEVQRTMLELLNQLDGFESSKDIKIIMATNRLDILDPALLRPGRIDRKIEFPPPTLNARTDILRIHSRSMNLTRGIDLKKIAEKMGGCSGAEIKGVCTEAEMHSDGKVTNDDFLSFAQELAVPGELKNTETFNFEFRNVEKMYESYRGTNVRLRYYLKVTVSRKSADIIKERELWVYQYVRSNDAAANNGTSSDKLSSNSASTTTNNSIASKNSAGQVSKSPSVVSTVKMDVGIESCLHIEFEYSKNRYPLKGVIVGRIYFLLVRLKIKHMELSLIRRETVGSGASQVSESTTVVRFEIMDGAPVKGETIPIRLFLGGFDLVPTYRDVNKKFSTRTFLSLVLIDEDARRYFKQSEIILYREE
ncbi:hypothetical protein PMKS-000069 [Pichia membranifaciens]|uniref:AAA+ ATPase domain-containing protein n=1 Tax=Pichia membranifaciens TaxID=4926 RepID=A0A1Q2YAP8_9ASCO|nr:hypothetical protein PMKS-000069 [Pichia membranifaciens]